MSETEELQFLASGLHRAHAFECNCKDHGVSRVIAESQPEKQQYPCPLCRETCRVFTIRAVIFTRQQLPVHVRKAGPVRLHM